MIVSEIFGYIYLGKLLRVKCSTRGLLFIACAIWMFVKQTPKSWFVLPLVSVSMGMTRGFLFPLMVALSLRFPDFPTRPSEGERLYYEGFRGSRDFVHVPIPISHYPEIQSQFQVTIRGCNVVLTFSPGKTWRKILVVRILCKSKFSLKLVLIDFNLSYLSSLKQIFIIWRYNYCGHFLTIKGEWNVIIVTNYIYIYI